MRSGRCLNEKGGSQQETCKAQDRSFTFATLLSVHFYKLLFTTHTHLLLWRVLLLDVDHHCSSRRRRLARFGSAVVLFIVRRVTIA